MEILYIQPYLFRQMQLHGSPRWRPESHDFPARLVTKEDGVDFCEAPATRDWDRLDLRCGIILKNVPKVGDCFLRFRMLRVLPAP